MSIDDYQKLPTEISKIGHHTNDHAHAFVMFCPNHDTICCPVCVSVNHELCSGLKDIGEVVSTAKISTLIENLEFSIIEIRKQFEAIVKDRQQNLTKIGFQCQRLQEEIYQMREKINCLLDKLENTLINELNEAENTIKSQIESLLSNLEERNETVGKFQNSIAALKTHATDLQAFIGCKTLSEKVSIEKKYIESLSENGNLQQINLKCDISDKVSNILTAVTSFGSISVSKIPLFEFLAKDHDKQTTITSPVEIQPTKSIDEDIPKKSKKLEIPQGKGALRLTGVDISPDGKVIIVDSDNNKRLIVFNQDGSVDRIIPLSPDHPYDVTCLDDKIVAVSIFLSKIIKLVNLASGTVCQTVKTDYTCAGITQRLEKLIYYGRGENVIILHDPNESTSSTIVKDPIKVMNYVTTFGDSIYHTNMDMNTVSCCKTSGEKIWEYKDTSILQTPYGITVDNHSNVYVASSGTDSVVIISPDGKHGREILKADDIKGPRTVQFDKVRNVLIVACYNGNVVMYNVS